MEGLYYPAVLGAAFFALLTRVVLQQGELLHDVSFWLAVVLVVLFSGAYLATHEVPEDQYGAALLVADLLEIAALAGAFAALGFADLTEPRRPNLLYCYWALVGLLAADSLWYWVTPNRTQHHWRRWSLALVASLAGIFFGSRYPWLHWVVTILFAFVALDYIADFGGLLKRKVDSNTTTDEATEIPPAEPAAQ
jgi:hypothetical protein